MRNTDGIVRHVSKNSSYVGPIDNLPLLVFYDLAILGAILPEVLYYCVLILLICISAKANLVFIGRLLSSLRYQLIQLIAHRLYPFSDGKCNKQASLSFYVEVSVCVAFFKV